MAKFYQTILIPIEQEEVLKSVYPERIASQLTLQERLPNCECYECKGRDWIILSKENPYVKDSGKPYIQCMSCGAFTHL